jgi:hypothetical protein
MGARYYPREIERRHKPAMQADLISMRQRAAKTVKSKARIFSPYGFQWDLLNLDFCICHLKMMAAMRTSETPHLPNTVEAFRMLRRNQPTATPERALHIRDRRHFLLFFCRYIS